METIHQSEPRISFCQSALFLLVLAVSTLGPWVLHFTVGWWAGMMAIPIFFAVYDALFVPRGSICMGIPFALPLGSAVLLIAFELLLLAKWVMATLAGA